MSEPEKLTPIGDFPSQWDDLRDGGGQIVVTVWTLKAAEEEWEDYSDTGNDKPHPGISKGTDGVYDIILDVPELTKKEVQKALDLLAKERGLHYTIF